MIRRLSLLLLPLLILVGGDAMAPTTYPAAAYDWILFTVPIGSQYRARIPDPAMPESLIDVVECAGGPETHDVMLVRLYHWPIDGTAIHIENTAYVRGMEGQTDSVLAETTYGGHFWATAIDTAGNESCPSEMVYKPPADLTAVPVVATDPPIMLRIFDVHGRLVASQSGSGSTPGPTAAGVYFFRTYYHSGKVKNQKVVLLK